MKTFIIALFLPFQIFANDQSFIIQNYNPVPEMDYQIELVLQQPVENQKLILDCQSFINGLVKYEYYDNKWEQSAFFMLSGNHCEDAMRFGLKAAETNSPYCLMINFEQFNLNLSFDLSLCNNNYRSY